MDKKQLSIILGENICKYRTQLGLTQAELAEKIGVNSSYISRIECAEKSMKIITLYNLAEALNLLSFQDATPKCYSHKFECCFSPTATL